MTTRVTLMFINLDKTPFINGRIIGRASRAALRKRIGMTRKARKSRGIREKLIDARIRDFTRHVKNVAPHWLDETKGIAEGAGVHVHDILMLNCLPHDFYPPGGNNCTSFISIGKDENRLFKIRDERNHIQSFFINNAKGHKAFHGANDIGNIGIAHFSNSSIVAGANNTGSHILLASDEPRLNDCHMLRFFAENASSVDDIPELFERLVGKNAAGGAGKGRGSIFMFIDPSKALLLECCTHDYSAKFISRGTLVVSNHFLTGKAKTWQSIEPNKNTLIRKNRMTLLLSRYDNRPSPPQIFAISRDRKSVPHSLCNDDKKHYWMTISAQLHFINRKEPDTSMSYICCGNTRHSVYIPVPVTFSENFKPLLSGKFYMNTDSLYREHRCSKHLKKIQKLFERNMLKRTDYRRIFVDACNLLRKTS